MISKRLLPNLGRRVRSAHPVSCRSPEKIDEALGARRAFKAMLRHGDVARLDNFERKSLSSFSFGTNGFLLPPKRSNIVLPCLVDPSRLEWTVQSRSNQRPVGQIFYRQPAWTAAAGPVTLRAAQEVELFFRHLADACLLLEAADLF
jgi:hypothetical protein